MTDEVTVARQQLANLLDVTVKSIFAHIVIKVALMGTAFKEIDYPEYCVMAAKLGLPQYEESEFSNLKLFLEKYTVDVATKIQEMEPEVIQAISKMVSEELNFTKKRSIRDNKYTDEDLEYLIKNFDEDIKA